MNAGAKFDRIMANRVSDFIECPFAFVSACGHPGLIYLNGETGDAADGIADVTVLNDMI